MNKPTLHRQRGITLIELMIVMAIIGILAGVAAPGFSHFIADRSLNAEARRVIGSLKLARSEARARGAIVTVSRGTQGWSGVINVYEDVTYAPTANNDFNAGQGDDQIRREAASGRSIVSADDQGSADRWIGFSPRGWLAEVNSIWIALCSPALTTAEGIYIEINRVGRIRERRIENDPRGCTP